MLDSLVALHPHLIPVQTLTKFETRCETIGLSTQHPPVAQLTQQITLRNNYPHPNSLSITKNVFTKIIQPHYLAVPTMPVSMMLPDDPALP
jgi:hypothetical protein